MLDYIKGIIFVLFFIPFLALFGKKIKRSDFFCENLIYGFIIYTCLQFVGGFVAQELRLPWLYYEIYMVVLLFALVMFSFYRNVPKISKHILIMHFKRYGIIYIIAVIFVFFAVMNIQYQWNANLVDDGYYLNKIRMAPSLANYTDYNFATGFSSAGSIVRNVNTFELEAAFYSYFFGIDASIYAKVFLAFINYTLLLNCIFWFYKTIAYKKEELKLLCLAIIPILFFGIYYNMMVNYGILNLPDGWQFNTAMWYGSTFVRTAGFFILLTPLLKKVTWKSILFFALSCIALLSKASQVLPVAILVACLYIVIVLFKYVKKQKLKKTALFALILFIILLCLVPISRDTQVRLNVINNAFAININMIIVKISIFLFALYYILGDALLKRWCTYLIIIGIFMFIPRLNTLFALSSLYDFVASRIVTLYIFTFIITAALCFYLLLIKFVKDKKNIYILYSCFAIVLIAIPVISIERNLGFINSLNIVMKNPKLIPESTLELGTKLEDLETTKKVDLNVLMPLWVNVDGTQHAIASMVRYNATSIYSIGSIPRYHDLQKSNPFNTFTQGDLDVFERYNNGIDRNDNKLAKILKNYKINCLVVNDDTAKRIVKRFGYKEIGKVRVDDSSNYYIVLYKA